MGRTRRMISHLFTWDLRYLRRRLWKMPCFGMWCPVALLRTDVSEVSFVSVIRTGKNVSSFLHSALHLLVTANFVPTSLILFTDDWGHTFLRNVCSHKSHTASQQGDGILHTLSGLKAIYYNQYMVQFLVYILMVSASY
jgi:hypothetical protein